MGTDAGRRSEPALSRPPPATSFRTALASRGLRAKIVGSIAVKGDRAERDGGRANVPLSEDEERIIREIERELSASDPDLVREVSSATVYRHAGRNLKWATAGFVAGAVFMVATLSVHPLVAFVGFLIMLASLLWFDRNLRKMGRAGWQEWSTSMRAAGMKDYFGGAGQRVKDRFKKEE